MSPAALNHSRCPRLAGHHGNIGIEVEKILRKATVSDREWTKQVEVFERGLKHANAIARELGVSPQTVSREMKDRGAVKGSRVGEYIIELNEKLDGEARDRAKLKAEKEKIEFARWLQISQSYTNRLDGMLDALMVADEAGDLALARPVVDHVGGAFPPKRRRR